MADTNVTVIGRGYLRQLHTGAAYVRSFEMSNAREVTDYYLFYATNELLGLKKMKEAV